MGVTVQVRDLDADVQERLRKAAVQEGLSLSAFLRRELTELARDLEVRERAGHETTLQAMLGGPLPGLDHISTQEIVDIIHEGRSERP
jgi:Antitoxin FitA-like, ribbon-helix-helix